MSNPQNTEKKQTEQTSSAQKTSVGFPPPHMVKRCILLCIGMAIMALGVSFSIKSNLGTSPISTLPYVLSVITPMSVGTATVLMNATLVLLEVLILRKNFQPFQVLQIVVAFIFGYLIDFFSWVIQSLSYSTYWQQWIYCIIGILLVGLGVSLEVVSRVVTLAGEGFVLAVCQVTPIKFGNMKIIFDVSLVVISCIISLIFTGTLYGVREGTIAAALCVGALSKQYQKPLLKLEKKYLM